METIHIPLQTISDPYCPVTGDLLLEGRSRAAIARIHHEDNGGWLMEVFDKKDRVMRKVQALWEEFSENNALYDITGGIELFLVKPEVDTLMSLVTEGPHILCISIAGPPENKWLEFYLTDAQWRHPLSGHA